MVTYVAGKGLNVIVSTVDETISMEVWCWYELCNRSVLNFNLQYILQLRFKIVLVFSADMFIIKLGGLLNFNELRQRLLLFTML